jgi:biotin synthase-related radical SAM superfamily protein
MQEELAELGGYSGIQETSRQMQSDEIVWQAFEEIARMIGVG